MATTAPFSTATYPVQLDVQRAPSQSRITNFPLFIGTLIRAILVIPHFIIFYVLWIPILLGHFLATFAILATGRYPQSLFGWYTGPVRWSLNVYAYLASLTDAYPPFGGAQRPLHPVQFQVDYPLRSSRLLNFPFIGFLIKYILLIPHLIALYALGIAFEAIWFIAAFAILFTGSYPVGLHDFSVGVMRWGVRVYGYLFGVTDRYPPFSLS